MLAAFAPLHFLLDKQELPAALAGNGGVFIGPPQQVGHYGFYGTIRQVLGGVVARISQVIGKVVAHAVELGKPDAGVAGRDAGLLHKLGEQQGAGFVVGAGADTDAVDVGNAVAQGFIVQVISSLLTGVDGVGIAALLGDAGFLVHIGPAHQLGADEVAFTLGSIVRFFQRIEAVVAVQLVGIPYNGRFAVVAGHHLIGQVVDGLLEPAFLGVDKQAHPVLVGALAKGVDPAHGPAVGCFFGRGEGLFGLNLLQNGYVGNARHLKHGKWDVSRAVGCFNRGQQLVAGAVVALVVAFAFHRVVEDGANVVLAQLFGDGAALGNGFAAAELLEDGVLD